MRQRRRYNDDFRASATLMLEAAGYPGRDGALSQVSGHLSVPRSTLRGWFTGAKKGSTYLTPFRPNWRRYFLRWLGREKMPTTAN
jgi:transposase-like protein